MHYYKLPAMDIFPVVCNLFKERKITRQSNICGFNYLQFAGQADISFCYCDDVEKLPAIKERVLLSKCENIIVDKTMYSALEDSGKNLFLADFPRFEFLLLVKHFCRECEFTWKRLKLPNVGPDVYVASEGVFLSKDIEIDGSCYIYPNTRIGENVIIKPFSCIGGNGFENVFYDGKLFFMPHLGGVVIEDNVMIGSSVNIDRGVFSDTRICSGTRIDNFVHIAHNVNIGDSSTITAGAIFGGSFIGGKQCFYGLNSTYKNGIHLGEKTTVGMGSAVVKNYEGNGTIYGVPAK